MSHGFGRRPAIIAALPSWYIDLTDERPLVVKRLQVPVISGTVDVRLQPRRPTQVLGAILVLLTYPLLLFVSVFGPLANFACSAFRLIVRVFGLQFPRSERVPIGPEKSVDRVNESLEQVSHALDQTFTAFDQQAQVAAAQPNIPRARRPEGS